MASRRKKPEATGYQSVDSAEPPGLEIGQVCRRLDVSRAKVVQLVKDGLIDTWIEDGINWYRESDVEDLEREGFAGNRKDVAFDQTIKALKAAHTHLDKFVDIIVTPLEKINDALLSENKSLREQMSHLYKERQEISELLATLQREQLTMQVEQEREKLNVEQRQEAFGLLKEQIVPAIVQNMSARKILEELDDEKFEVLIASGILDSPQEKVLKNYFAQRKAKAAKEAEKAAKEAEEQGATNGRKSTGSGT